MIDFGHVSGVLLAMLLSVTLGRAGSLDARSPQDVDDGDTISLHFYTPTPSHTIPSWYTMTSSASQSTASVSFAFGEIQDTVVCGQNTISWTYSGDTSYMIGIAAMGVDVESTDSSSDLPTVLTILDEGLEIGQNTYNWSPVNVAPGIYVLEVSIPNVDLLYYSEAFYVFNSSDNSCLTSSSSSTSSEPSSTTGSASSTSIVGSSSVSSSSVGDTSSVPVVGAVTGGSSMSRGGIAGVVIGGLAFVGGLITILVLLRRCRSSRATGAPRGGLFEKRRPKGAISINSRGGSFSSTHGAPARGMGSTFGMAPHYNLNDPSRSALGHGISDEDVGTPSIIGEKPLTHAPLEIGMAPAAVHRSPHAYRDSLGSVASGSTTVGSPGGVTSHYRPSRHSSLLYTSDPFGSSPSTPSPRPSGDYQRPSGNQSQVPVALFSPHSAASTPHTFDSPGVPRDISIASSSSPDLAYEADIPPPSPAVVAPAVSRRAPPVPPAAAPASAQAARRSKSASARKPVPVYAPSVSGEALELVEPSTPHSTIGAPASYYHSSTGQHSGVSLTPSSAGNDWSSAAAHSHSHSPASGASPMSSGSYMSHGSGHSLPNFAGHAGMPELNHKSSFGDRQLHVLMPDPPPQEMQ